MKIKYFRRMFEKQWNIRLHENPSSGSRISCRQTETDRRADERSDMTKLIVAFRNFPKAPKIKSQFFIIR